MLGVISTHEPIRGEFAKSVRKMLQDGNKVKQTMSQKESQWVIKAYF